MVFRSVLILGACAALAACQPAIPDSGAGVADPGRGVGFDNPSTLAAREARARELEAGAPVPAAPNVAAQPLPPTPSAIPQVLTPSSRRSPHKTTRAPHRRIPARL